MGLKEEPGLKVGMQEQAAIAIADLAYRNADMQDAIIEADGVGPLLAFIRTGSQLGQEHAARAIWNLATLQDTQGPIVEQNAIPDLVQLLKTGSPKAQENAAAAISELALGAVKEREAKEKEAKDKAKKEKQASEKKKTELPLDKAGAVVGSAGVAARRDLHRSAGFTFRDPSSYRSAAQSSHRSQSSQRSNPFSRFLAQVEASILEEEDDIDSSDRLVAIADAGGINPLVRIAELRHDAGTRECRRRTVAPRRRPFKPERDCTCQWDLTLVTILDDGTVQAHKHAADALARLAHKNGDNQGQIAKHCVRAPRQPEHRRAAARRKRPVHLAKNHPGSPVIIVNAGAISPLVQLLSSGANEVKEEAAGALSTLAFNSPSTQLAIASGLVVLVGCGSGESQEHVSQLLLRLAHDPENCVAINKAGAIPRLVTQLRGGGRTSVKAQELAVAVLSFLTKTDDSIKAIASANGIRSLVNMLTTGTPAAQSHAAAILSDMAKSSSRNQQKITSDGAIAPLVNLLQNHERRADEGGGCGRAPCPRIGPAGDAEGRGRGERDQAARRTPQ